MSINLFQSSLLISPSYFIVADKKFLLFDHIDGSTRVTGFALPKHLKILKRARYWQLDGTFDVCPLVYSQLVSIHAPLDEEDDSPVVPLVYILMSKKTEKMYDKAFQMLNAELDKIDDPAVSPDFLFTDFELALINALKKNFPTSKLKGCNVHLRRIIFRHIVKCGHKKEYVRNITFNKQTKLIAALAYLHPEQIKQTFDKVSKELMGKAPKLVAWFQKNYVGKCKFLLFILFVN